MGVFLRNFHYSARQLRKNPGFAATSVMTLGLAATMAVQKLIASVVRIHAEKDAMTIAGLVVLLIVAGLLAVLLPARRAATVEPVKALRYE